MEQKGTMAEDSVRLPEFVQGEALKVGGPTETKPGWTTTEFWKSAVFIAVMVIAALQASEADWALKAAAILGAAISAAGYGISRGLAKK